MAPAAYLAFASTSARTSMGSCSRSIVSWTGWPEVEIEIRRARRAEFTLRLATFPEAPLRSRTVGFPESGSGLGSVPISQGGPSPTARNCGAGAPFAPTRWSLHRPFATNVDAA